MFPVFSPVPQKETDTLNHTDELLRALEHSFLCIIKLDLNTGNSWLLQNAGSSDQNIRAMDWKDYIAFYSGLLSPLETQKLEEFLSISYLKNLRESETKQHSLDFSCREELQINGFRITASFPSTPRDPCVYILTQPSGDDQLLKRIVDLYVYNTCDYFIYLDAKNNSYILFGGNESGTPLPPTVCSDYSSELVKYAHQHVVPEDVEMVIQEMQLDRVLSVLKDHEVHAFFCGICENGQYARKRLEYRCYDRENQMILLTRTDITDIYNEQLRQNQKIKDALQRALADPLTGLLNYQGIREEVARSLSESSQMAALLFLDLDDFKSVNDTHGHATGDEALYKVAEVLKRCIRSRDFASRIGGDEFVIFLKGIRSPEDAAGCAQRICDQISQIYLTQDSASLSCSIGVAIAPRDGATYDDLVKKADKRVYRSKAGGKNQFTL